MILFDGQGNLMVTPYGFRFLNNSVTPATPTSLANALITIPPASLPPGLRRCGRLRQVLDIRRRSICVPSSALSCSTRKPSKTRAAIAVPNSPVSRKQSVNPYQLFGRACTRFLARRQHNPVAGESLRRHTDPCGVSFDGMSNVECRMPNQRPKAWVLVHRDPVCRDDPRDRFHHGGGHVPGGDPSDRSQQPGDDRRGGRAQFVELSERPGGDAPAAGIDHGDDDQRLDADSVDPAS